MLLASPVLAQTPPSPGAVLQPAQVPQPAPEAPAARVIALPAPAARTKGGTRLLIPVRRFRIKGNHWLPTSRVEALVAPAAGRTLTLGQIDAVVGRITDAYRAAGYPVAYAYLPAQTIRDGVLEIRVVEPRYDRIILAGPSRLDDAQTLATVGVKAGDPVAERPLARGLLLLQQTPGLTVKGVLVPGAQPGTSSLKLERKDQRILSASVSVDNHGNSYTGRGLASATLTARGPFRRGSLFSANALTSQSGGLVAGGVMLVSPDLHNGLRAGAYASASRYHLGGAFAALEQTGRSAQAGVDVAYPLVLQPGRQAELRLDLLKTWLSQDTRATGAVSGQHLAIARLSFGGALRDARGGLTSGRIALSLGRLALSPAADQAADAAGPRAAGSFALLRVNLSRSQRLPHGFTLSAYLSAQLSSRNLDSSQQFFLGGPDGVMSTDVGSGGGDEGLLLRLKLSHPLPAARLSGRLDAALIAQFGAVRVHHSLYARAGALNDVSAGALGIGVNYTRGDVTLQAAIVAPVESHGLSASGHLWLATSIAL